MKLKTQLETFGFSKIGYIIYNKSKNSFEIKIANEKGNKEGWIYLWVEEKNDEPLSIRYIGLAGTQILKRMNEQIKGLNGGSDRGKINATKLKKIIEKDRKISIYTRYSDKIELFGKTVSLCHTEEKALILYFKETKQPIFNKL